jgi:heme A synthase
MFELQYLPSVSSEYVPNCAEGFPLVPVIVIALHQGSTNPGRRFCGGTWYSAHNYCSLFLTYKNVCHFTCTWRKPPNSSEVQRWLHSLASTVQNLVYFTLLTLRIWEFLIYFWKLCIHCIIIIIITSTLPVYCNLQNLSSAAKHLCKTSISEGLPLLPWHKFCAYPLQC